MSLLLRRPKRANRQGMEHGKRRYQIVLRSAGGPIDCFVLNSPNDLEDESTQGAQVCSAGRGQARGQGPRGRAMTLTRAGTSRLDFLPENSETGHVPAAHVSTCHCGWLAGRARECPHQGCTPPYLLIFSRPGVKRPLAPGPPTGEKEGG